ncbi:MAG: hypothetical protein H7175_08720, partial [Burkholderiales bacterium]|nr:hypothetical protein [Anaerolineae bacterium]
MRAKRFLISAAAVAVVVLGVTGHGYAQTSTPTGNEPALSVLLRIDLPADAVYSTDDVTEVVAVLERRLADIDGAMVTSGNESGTFVEVLLPPVTDSDTIIADLVRPGLLELVDFSGVNP